MPLTKDSRLQARALGSDEVTANRETLWIVNLELTNACNLACIFCDHPVFVSNGMKCRDMEPALLETALSGLDGDVIHELGLVGLGEPTLARRLSEHLEVIGRHASRFDRISLNSNLVSLKPPVANQLLASSVNTYTFSLNASNRETYKELMGRDLFDRAVENLKSFILLRRSLGKRVSVSVQLFDSPGNSLEELARVIEVGDDLEVFVRKAYTKPVLLIDSPLLSMHRPPNERRYPCWDIYTRVYVDVDGNVYPCTIGNDSYRSNSELCLGNIRRTSLSELFNGERIREARRCSEEGGLPFHECTHCNVWSLTPNNFRWDGQVQRWVKKQKPVRAYGLK